MFPEESGLKFCSKTETVSGEVRGVSCVHERSGEDLRTIADIVETTTGIASVMLRKGKVASITLEGGACATEISGRSDLGVRMIEVLARKRIPELVSAK